MGDLLRTAKVVDRDALGAIYEEGARPHMRPVVEVEPDAAIERMAQRAWDDEGGPESGLWDDLPEWGKDRYRELARSMWDAIVRLDDE